MKILISTFILAHFFHRYNVFIIFNNTNDRTITLLILANVARVIFSDMTTNTTISKFSFNIYQCFSKLNNIVFLHI